MRTLGIVPCGDIVAMICSRRWGAIDNGRLQSKYEVVEIEDGADEEVSIGREETDDDG